MEREREFSVDHREARFLESARLISRLQAGLLDDLEWFDVAQVATGDGCQNLSEWVSKRLDVSLDTARSLVRTMRRTVDKPHLREALADGTVSFDRVEALSRLEGEKDLFEHLDIEGARRLASDRVEITSEDEADLGREQFLVLQPALDQSWWKVWGGFDGVTGAVIDRALTERADLLPSLPDGTRGSAPWRRAIALYELASGGASPQAQVTLFVDTSHAVATDAAAGVRLEAGPRVGAQGLAAVLCDSVTEVTVNGDDGVPMRYGRRSRNIPQGLRRAVLARNGGHCEVFGCDSRYRVEVHHRTPWSEGGTTDPENLVAVCWFHHHIAIHQRGFTVHTDPRGRIVLKRPADNRAPPPS